MNLAVTAYHLANCLGETTELVMDRMASGEAGLRHDLAPNRWGFEPSFSSCYGVMGELENRLLLHQMEGVEVTRQLRIVWASVIQIEGPVKQALSTYGSHRVGYVFSSSTGGLAYTEDHFKSLSESKGHLESSDKHTQAKGYEYRHHQMDATSRWVTSYLGIDGPVSAISTACSSGLKALVTAASWLQSGLVDAVLVGAADTLCLTTICGFYSLAVLSPEKTQAFSRHRSGINLGEGSAFVLLERQPCQQVNQKKNVYLTGLGERSDAYHLSSPDPEGRGAFDCMQQALTQGKLSFSDLRLVYAHGTGTIQNDAMEAKALMLGQKKPELCDVVATKSFIGHLLGASGLSSFVLAAESLASDRPLPSCSLEQIRHELETPLSDSKLSFLPFRSAPSPRKHDHALVNAFAFGGNNASALLRSEGHLYSAPFLKLPRRHSQEPWSMRLRIFGFGFFSPRFANLGDALSGTCLTDDKLRTPKLDWIPPRQKRFTSLCTQMQLETIGLAANMVAFPLSHDPTCELEAVFASSYGEIVTAYELLFSLKEQGQLSSAKFVQSVHSTASGLWSILAKHKGPSTTLSVDQGLCSAAFLEAALRLNHSPEDHPLHPNLQASLELNQHPCPKVLLLTLADDVVPSFFKPNSDLFLPKAAPASLSFIFAADGEITPWPSLATIELYETPLEDLSPAADERAGIGLSKSSHPSASCDYEYALPQALLQAARMAAWWTPAFSEPPQKGDPLCAYSDPIMLGTMRKNTVMMARLIEKK